MVKTRHWKLKLKIFINELIVLIPRINLKLSFKKSLNRVPFTLRQSLFRHIFGIIYICKFRDFFTFQVIKILWLNFEDCILIRPYNKIGRPSCPFNYFLWPIYFWGTVLWIYARTLRIKSHMLLSIIYFVSFHLNGPF